MKLAQLNQIIEDLTDINKPLYSSLLKASVLADDLDSDLLAKWLDQELSGYLNTPTVPNYRKVNSFVKGTLLNTWTGQRLYDMDIPIDVVLAEEQGKMLYEETIAWKFREPIETLEDLYNSKGEATKLSYPVAPGACRLLNGLLEKRGDALLVLDAVQYIPITGVKAVLSSTRKIFLNLLLTLKRKLKQFEAENGEIPITPQVQLTVKQTVINVMSINNYGHGAIFNSGDSNTFNVNNNIQAGDMNALKDALQRMNVPQDDILEIEIILNEEQQGPELGQRALGWIVKMMSKAVSKAWDVSLELAAKALPSVIGAYCGIPISL
ncbi:MAG: hypothetical protein EOP48_01120 [Sphingobacteriales bacterium]|nr:MAG: hypothetical protein EOP48_01120 [Sphingobacteriales bacterium]